MNNIDVALIPPGALATQYCEGRRVQMALAGEMIDYNRSNSYREFYNQAWKAPHSEWLLDNGAWETEALSPDELIRVAQKCRATEVMSPDVLYEPLQTWQKTDEFLTYYRDFYKDRSQLGRPKPSVAVVAHGKSVDDAMNFIAHVYEHAPEVKTIAISRTTCYKSGDPTARMEIAVHVKKAFKDRFKIHLLGYSDHWPSELQFCNSFPSLVRSMDTIAPFSYTYHGHRIVDAGLNHVPRPDKYFDMIYSDFDHNLLEENIRAMDQIARTSWFKGVI